MDGQVVIPSCVTIIQVVITAKYETYRYCYLKFIDSMQKATPVHSPQAINKSSPEIKRLLPATTGHIQRVNSITYSSFYILFVSNGGGTAQPSAGQKLRLQLAGLDICIRIYSYMYFIIYLCCVRNTIFKMSVFHDMSGVGGQCPLQVADSAK